MKKIIGFSIGLALSASMTFAELDMVTMPQIAEVPTNETATASGTATNDAFTYGLVEAIIFDVGSSYTGVQFTATIETAPSGGTGYSRTIWGPKSNITADVIYYVRGAPSTIAGAAIANSTAKIPLVQDKLVVKAYSAQDTNVVPVDTYIILSR